MIYDKDIRQPLCEFFLKLYGKIRTFEEKNMGSARADILLVTEHHLIGVKIKSDADTYARLARQIREYDGFCTQNIVVVGASHLRHIGERVPKHWGIISVVPANGDISFAVVREPRDNTKNKWEKTLHLLWRSELARLQKENSLFMYKRKSKQFVIRYIASLVPQKMSRETITRQICDMMLERDYSVFENK